MRRAALGRALENPRAAPPRQVLDLADIRNALKAQMWRSVGVRRDAEGLGEALENIDHWGRYVSAQQFSKPFGWELQNMLCVAWFMIRAALERTETRGCHVRTDFPQRDDPAWHRHVTFRRQEGGQ